jgi:hypothetical protein
MFRQGRVEDEALSTSGDTEAGIEHIKAAGLALAIVQAMVDTAPRYDIAYGDSKFAAVANSSNKAVYSTDGIIWTVATLSRHE